MPDNTLNPALNYKPKQPETQEDVITSLVDDIRSNYPISQNQNKSQDAFNAPIPLPDSNRNPYKVSFQEDIPFEDVYNQVSDGSYQAMFPNFIKGTNNWERMAQEQTTGEKWKNGALKALGNIGTTFLGGTVGAVNGVSELIKTGSLSAIYDNEFSNNLMNWNEKLGYQLPNYYTQEEKDLNLFQATGTANFWADKVLHGLSFTVGTLASEAVWATATGGTSLASSGARVGFRLKNAAKLAQAQSKVSSGIKQMVRSGELSASAGKNIGRGIDVANTLRFTYTSAGTEAGIEALSFKREAEQAFYSDIQQRFGRQPNAQEIADFEKDLNNTANSVFGTNLALVGSSNLAIFGRMFNINNPFRSAQSAANKRIFGIGYKEGTAEGRRVFQALKPTKLQKFTGGTYGLLKAPVIEGVWEEGMQSVTQNGAQRFLASTYDPDVTQQNIGIVESVYEGLAETYGSKEGWKEVGVGMIVGLFGGGISGSFSEVSQKRKQNEQNVQQLNLYSAENVLEHFKVANGISKAVEDINTAEANNDLLGKDLSTRRMMYFNAMANARAEREDAIEDFQVALEGMPKEYWQQMGIDPTNQEEIANVKENLITQYKEVQDSYKRNKAAAEYIVGRGNIAGVENTAELQEAVAYSMTMGEASDNFAKQAFEQIENEFASAVGIGEKFKSGIKVDEVVSKATKNTRERFYYHRSNVRKYQRRLEEATDKLRQIQTQSRGENVQLADKLKNAEDNLLKAQERVAQEQQKLEELFNIAKLENPYAEDNLTISVDDLTNSEQNLKDAEGYLKNIKDSNPVRYQRLSKLLKEYQKANYAFRQFNKTVEDLTSNDLKIQEFGDFLSSKLYKGKKANEFTSEFFTNQLNNYRQAFTQTGQDLESEQLNYRENTTNRIVNKKISGEDLNDAEREYYNENKDFVDTQVKNKKVADVIIDEGQNFLTEEQQKHYSENKEDIDNLVNQSEQGDSITPTQPQTTPPIEDQSIDERIKNAIDNSSAVMKYVDTEVDEIEAAKPTKKDVERFEELDNENRTEEEEQEYQELQTKLSNWRIVDGTLDPNGYSIADLLEIKNQNESLPYSDNIKTTLSEQEVLDVALVDEKDGTRTVDNVNYIQTYENTKVKVSENKKDLVFSHLNIESVVVVFGVDNVRVRTPRSKDTRPLTESMLKEYRKKPNTVFEINTPNGKISATIMEHGRISIPIEQFNEVKDVLNFRLVNPQLTRNSYFDVYEKVGEEFIPRKSDFKLETTGRDQIIILEPQEIENLKAGDNLVFRVNLESVFNHQLKNNYLAATSEEEIKKAYDDIVNNLEIYTETQDNKVVGVVKAATGNISNTAQENQLSIRQAAATKFLDAIEQPGRSFTLETKLPVSNILLGTPNLKLTEENGVLKPVNIDFTEESLEKVTDFGYKENGQYFSKNDMGDVNKSFLSNTNKDEKTPFIVFKHGDQKIAYPVSLKTTTVDASGQIVDINNSDLSVSEKIVRVNDILLENGIRPTEYDLVNATVNNIDSKIDAIIEQLSTKEMKSDVTTWKDSNKSVLKDQASISIDLENRPLRSPKIMVDFTNVEIQDEIPVVESEDVDTEVPNKNQVNTIKNEPC